MRAFRKSELRELDAAVASDSAKTAVLQKMARKQRTQVEADDAEVAFVESQTRDFLCEAASFYMRSFTLGESVLFLGYIMFASPLCDCVCMIGDAHGHAVFPLCSLWFSDDSGKVSTLLDAQLDTIPSQRWIQLSYQVRHCNVHACAVNLIVICLTSYDSLIDCVAAGHGRQYDVSAHARTAALEVVARCTMCDIVICCSPHARTHQNTRTR